MAFLTINGRTVQCAVGTVEVDTILRRSRSRSASGAGSISNRGDRERWRIRGVTTPMSMAEAVSLVRTILGIGEAWQFNGDPGVSGESLLSSAGRSPSTSSNAVLLGNYGHAADGDPLYQMSHAEAEYSALNPRTHGSVFAGSLRLPPATTNIATVKDTAGDSANWNTTGVVASSNSSHKFVGAGSVNLAFTGTAGVADREIATGVDGSSLYAASFWIKSSQTSAKTIYAYLRDETNAIDGTPVAIPLPSSPSNGPLQWVRVENVQVTTGAGTPTLGLYLSDTDNDKPNAYIDAIQVEKVDTGATPIQGSAPYTASSWDSTSALVYSSIGLPADADGVTLAFWVRASANLGIGNGNGAPLVDIYDADGGSRILIQYTNTTNYWSALVEDAFGNQHYVKATVVSPSAANIFGSYPTDNAFHCHVAVFDFAAPGFRSYFDATTKLDGYYMGGRPTLSLLDTIAINSKFFNGDVSEVRLYPYAMHANEALALGNLPYQLPPLPRCLAIGDVVPHGRLIMTGTAEAIPIHPGNASGSWTSRDARVGFTLEEV